MPALDGTPAASFMTRHDGGRISVTAGGDASGWQVLLVGAAEVDELDGASASTVPEGVLLTSDGSNAVAARYR